MSKKRLLFKHNYFSSYHVSVFYKQHATIKENESFLKTFIENNQKKKMLGSESAVNYW